MNVADIIDAALPAPHGNRQGLSSGQLTTLWLTYILTQYNHRMCPVETWARERRRTLEHATGWTIGDKDLTDDRLADVLSALGGSTVEATATPAETIELTFGQHLIRAYALPTAVARLDTTSVSVYHGAQDRDDQPRTLLHYGHSKDGHPERRQFIQALGTLDPVGVPLVTATLPGEKADGPLYLPQWQRMAQIIGRPDFLFVADSKLSSRSNRAQLHAQGGFYLCPLAMVGKHETWLQQWVLEPPTESQPLVYDEVEWGCGFELTLGQRCELSLPHTEATQHVCWEERQLIIKSHAFAEREIAGLDKRLNTAEAALLKLAQRPGDIREKLEIKMQQLLKKYRVAEFFDTGIVEEVTREFRHVGRGRPGANRPKREETRTHLRLKYHRREPAISSAKQLAGWRIYVTNAPATRLGLRDAVSHYRGQWQPERGFHRFKSGVVSALPIYLDDETRIRGLMLVLGMALRFLTLVEFVVRQALVKEQTEVAGLYDGNPKRKTKQPTTERLLKAFQNITLSCFEIEGRQVHHLTALSNLQKQILRWMDIPESIYAAPAPDG